MHVVILSSFSSADATGDTQPKGDLGDFVQRRPFLEHAIREASMLPQMLTVADASMWHHCSMRCMRFEKHAVDAATGFHSI